jgi:hemin uptake protein HemP
MSSQGRPQSENRSAQHEGGPVNTRADCRPHPLPPVGDEGGDEVAAAAKACAPSPQIDSDEIFAGATEVRINHHGAIYRLRLTSLGKLILTK